MTFYLFRYLCESETKYYTFDSDYSAVGIPTSCPNGHTQVSGLTLVRSFEGPARYKGATKKFPDNLAQNARIDVIPVAGSALILVRVSAYRAKNTADSAVIFEILVGSTIVSQSYFKNLNQLKARANSVKVIGEDTHMEYLFPFPSNPDFDPVKLSASLGMKLSIYLTADAQHGPSGTLTAYTVSSSPLGKADGTLTGTANDPDAPVWIETISLDE